MRIWGYLRTAPELTGQMASETRQIRLRAWEAGIREDQAGCARETSPALSLFGEVYYAQKVQDTEAGDFVTGLWAEGKPLDSDSVGLCLDISYGIGCDHLMGTKHVAKGDAMKPKKSYGYEDEFCHVCYKDVSGLRVWLIGKYKVICKDCLKRRMK